jgi:hypothetical protein
MIFGGNVTTRVKILALTGLLFSSILLLTPAVSSTAHPHGVPNKPTSIAVQAIPLEFFKLGSGYTDVIPHQIVRTSQDKVYLFAANGVNSSAIQVYWTNDSGIPSSKNDFSGSLTYNATQKPISVEAAYDGGSIIHVLANLVDGTLYDYPFDLAANIFKSPHLISSGDPVRTTLYPGTTGVSAMVGLDGILNVAYWNSGNHVTYRPFRYNPVSDTLTPQTTPFQVDSAGSASHPVLAVSPYDGSVTVAWLSEAVNPHQVLGRTKTSAGWGNIEQVSNPTVRVWTYVDPQGGASVDQGPSLIITADGHKHLSYIEDTDSTGSYGRTHYVYYTSQNGWQDTRLNYYTHNPSLATNSSSGIYLFGHGMYLDSRPCGSVNDVCYLKKNTNGTWGAPQMFATHPSGETFDNSVSTKWSVVGWTRPELIEVAFFSGSASNYWNMSLYYGTLGGFTCGANSCSHLYLPLIMR